MVTALSCRWSRMWFLDSVKQSMLKLEDDLPAAPLVERWLLMEPPRLVAPERGHSLLPSPPCFIHRRLGTASLVWVSLRASVISSDGTGSIDCSFSAQLSPPQGRRHLKMHPLPSWSGRHLTVDYLTCMTLHTETTNIMQHVANVSFSAVQPFFFSFFFFIRLSIIWSKLWVNEVNQLSSRCFSAFFKLIFECYT